ncbi:septum formation initiator family protein [Candidatus Babeliales bacterium]|nr:septum formation initiator family protein [Candidatus Babeliales bacterium]
MKFKIIIRTLILFVACLFFVKFIIWGNLGIVNYFDNKKKIELEKNKIVKLEQKIKILKGDIEEFLGDDFELQRMAREDLQMGFVDEKVYLLVDE